MFTNSVHFSGRYDTSNIRRSTSQLHPMISAYIRHIPQLQICKYIFSRQLIQTQTELRQNIMYIRPTHMDLMARYYVQIREFLAEENYAVTKWTTGARTCQVWILSMVRRKLD